MPCAENPRQCHTAVGRSFLWCLSSLVSSHQHIYLLHFLDKHYQVLASNSYREERGLMRNQHGAPTKLQRRQRGVHRDQQRQPPRKTKLSRYEKTIVFASTDAKTESEMESLDIFQHDHSGALQPQRSWHLGCNEQPRRRWSPVTTTCECRQLANLLPHDCQLLFQ